MAIIPFRENPSHDDAHTPAVHHPDNVLAGTAESDLWWWDPTKTEMDAAKKAYNERIARRIRPGFYKGTQPHDEGRPT